MQLSAHLTGERKKPGTQKLAPEPRGLPTTPLPSASNLPAWTLSLAPNHWRRKALFQVSMTQESLIGPAGIMTTHDPITVVREWNILIGWPELPTHFCDTEGRNGSSVVDRSPKAPKEMDEK